MILFDSSLPPIPFVIIFPPLITILSTEEEPPIPLPLPSAIIFPELIIILLTFPMELLFTYGYPHPLPIP